MAAALLQYAFSWNLNHAKRASALPEGSMHNATRSLFATALACGLACPALGQTTPATDLRQASIEDLMNIQITSASRKEQRTADVAAAVFVITHDDILRSGMTTIPDVLRMVPGVEVAQI